MKKLSSIKLTHEIENMYLLNEVMREIKEKKEERNKKLSPQKDVEPLITKEEELNRIKIIFRTYALKGSSKKKYFS